MHSNRVARHLVCIHSGRGFAGPPLSGGSGFFFLESPAVGYSIYFHADGRFVCARCAVQCSAVAVLIT